MARAALVADILQRFGFRAEVKEDATFARQEGREEGFMRERLRILGYLIIHTRQLDSRAPCWRGASTLSVRQAIYETVHWPGASSRKTISSAHSTSTTHIPYR